VGDRLRPELRIFPKVEYRPRQPERVAPNVVSLAVAPGSDEAECCDHSH
jgi:hypothetical protein